EELGITARFDDLIPVGVRVTVARYEGLIDREFADNFLLVRDTAIGDYPYQQDEVSGLVALNIDETLALFAGERETIHAEAVGLGTSPVEISLEHFIPLVDRPFYKALVLAKRCLNGEKHLVLCGCGNGCGDRCDAAGRLAGGARDLS